jgi:hypothetical protein
VADDARRRWLGREAALGGLLVLLGLVVLLGQAVDVEVGRVAWPVFVIVPGLGLLGLGLASAGRLGEVLATVGGVVTMAGLAPADQVVCRVAEVAIHSSSGSMLTLGPSMTSPPVGGDRRQRTVEVIHPDVGQQAGLVRHRSYLAKRQYYSG